MMDPTADDQTDPTAPKKKPVAATPVQQQPAPAVAPAPQGATNPATGGVQSMTPPPIAPPPIAPVQPPMAAPAPAKRAYTAAAPATAQEQTDDSYDRGWLDIPNSGGNKYNPSTHYIDPRTGAAEFLVNGQIPDAPAQNSGPMVTAPGGNLVPAGDPYASFGPRYQGAPLDAHGQLVTPNTQSDGAGGFRSDAPVDGNGLPLGGSWADTASGGPLGTPAAISPLSGYTSSGSLSPSPASQSAPVAQSGTPNGVSVNTIDPNNDLRDKSVLPGAGVDRFKLVSDRLNNYRDQMLPELRAKVRGTVQSNAARGRTQSGMLRTDLGNLDLAAERDLNAKFSDLLSDATEGTIGDARSDRNEYRNERGYENTQEQNAFDRERQGVYDEDYFKGTDFQRAMQRLMAGEQGNPSGALTSIGNNQANAAQDSIGALVNGVQTSHAGAGSSPDFAAIIADILKNRGTPPIANNGGGYLPDDEYGVAY